MYPEILLTAHYEKLVEFVRQFFLSLTMDEITIYPLNKNLKYFDKRFSRLVMEVCSTIRPSLSSDQTVNFQPCLYRHDFLGVFSQRNLPQSVAEIDITVI